MKVLNKLLLIMVLAVSMSCEPEIENVLQPAPGQADFSTYVALGNSLTAGYADGALHREGQLVAYPALIAEQLEAVGGSNFVQPLVPVGNGINGSGAGKFELAIINGSPFPVPTSPDPAALGTPTEQGPYNNLGIPGAKSFHLITPGYGSPLGNPFFARFATSAATTVVGDAAALNPTFFTLWIGNNDILGYALDGGADSPGDSLTGTATFEQSVNAILASLSAGNADLEGALANIPDITAVPYFNTVPFNAFVLDENNANLANASLQQQIEPVVTAQVITTVASATGVATEAVYTQAFNEAKAQGADDATAAGIAQDFVGSPEGMTAIAALRDQIIDNLGNDNITDATLQMLVATTNTLISTPAARPTELQQQIDLLIANPSARPAELQAAIDAQIQGLKDAGFYPTLQVGPNGFLITDENSPTGIRLATASDKILLTVASLTTAQVAAGPLADSLVLTVDEIQAIEQARTSYNTILANAATAGNYALVDIDGLFDNLSNNGLFFNGQIFTADFITGNAFSLDGIHLTPAGNAIVANEFIRAINNQYGSVISPLNVVDYKGNSLP